MNHPQTTVAAALSITLLLVLTTGLPVAAQQQQQNQEETVEVSDSELTSVARAYVDLRKIQATYRAKLKGPKAKQAQAQMKQEMTQAVEKQDLTMKRYRTVITAAQKDKALRSRLLKEIKALQSAESPDQ